MVSQIAYQPSHMVAERHVSAHRHEEALLLTASGPALLEAILARLKGAEDRMAAARCCAGPCCAVLCCAVLCCAVCTAASHPTCASVNATHGYGTKPCSTPTCIITSRAERDCLRNVVITAGGVMHCCAQDYQVAFSIPTCCIADNTTSY